MLTKLFSASLNKRDKYVKNAETASKILKQTWDIAYLKQPHVLRVNVSNLRSKLENDPSRPQHIITEPGVGYRLR